LKHSYELMKPYIYIYTLYTHTRRRTVEQNNRTEKSVVHLELFPRRKKKKSLMSSREIREKSNMVTRDVMQYVSIIFSYCQNNSAQLEKKKNNRIYTRTSNIDPLNSISFFSQHRTNWHGNDSTVFLFFFSPGYSNNDICDEFTFIFNLRLL
jgi:hypothetical protein